MTREAQRFAPRGVLALDPQAFGQMFDVASPAAIDQRDRVAVVDVRGPLMHHAGWFFDSYEGIAARVAEALETRPRAVVLRLDSPGGLVSGMLDTARGLRAMSEAAEVPLIAYVDGAALSAAYAIACGCSRIVTSETGVLGSIGTLNTLTDATARFEAQGLKHRLVTSGARKLDGNPLVAISDDAVAAAQELVDELAELFFAHVAEARPALDVDAVRGLDARIAHGATAVSLGLADEVATFEGLLAQIASRETAPAAEENTMSTQESARKALKAILDDDDADEKAKAKARKALAAMDEDDSDDKKESKAEGDDDKKESKSTAESEDDEDEKKEAKASATPAPAVAAVPAEVTEMAAYVRGQMLDGRPDLSPKMRALLEKKPLAEVREYLDAHPKPNGNSAAAAAGVVPTRGAGQGEPGAPITESDRELAASMDAAMGLTALKPGVKRTDTQLFLGVPVPADATNAG